MEGDTLNGIAAPGESLTNAIYRLPEGDAGHDLWLALAAADWQHLELNRDDASSLLTQIVTHLSKCHDCLSLVRYVRALALQGEFDTADDAESGRALGRLLAQLEAAATEDAVSEEALLYAQVLVLDGEEVATASFPEVAAHLEVCTTCQREVESQQDQLAMMLPLDILDRITFGVAAIVWLPLPDTLASASRKVAIGIAGIELPALATESAKSAVQHAMTLHQLQLHTLKSIPRAAFVVQRQSEAIPAWLDGQQQIWQLWDETCTAIGSRMYLDTVPLPCIVHETGDTREIVLLLPESLCHTSHRVEWSVADAGRWEERHDMPLIPWEQVLGAHAATTTTRTGPPPAVERPLPAEPWHHALRTEIARQFSRSRQLFSRSEEVPAASYAFANQLRDPSRVGHQHVPPREGERHGLAHLAAGILCELAAQSGTPEQLELALANYEQALQFLPPRDFPVHDAFLRRRLGFAYFQHPTQTDEGRVNSAINMYREALETFLRLGRAQDAAICRVNLGNVLAHSAKRRHERLQEAIKSYTEALRIVTIQEQPVAWAATQNNLGMAYREQGEVRRDRRLLEMAVGSIREALRVFTKDRFRAQYGLAQQQLGLAHHQLELLGSTAGGNAHIAAYNEALHAFNPDHFPTERAALNLQLGRAHAEHPGGGQLAAKSAAHHLHEALKTYTKDTHPDEYRQAQQLLKQIEPRTRDLK